jgi:hypothetical protein
MKKKGRGEWVPFASLWGWRLAGCQDVNCEDFISSVAIKHFSSSATCLVLPAMMLGADTSARSSPTDETADQRYEKQNQEKVEKKLCDFGCRNRDTRETENRCNDRNHEERERPTQHVSSSDLKRMFCLD